jgi:hypothetical protein
LNKGLIFFAFAVALAIGWGFYRYKWANASPRFLDPWEEREKNRWRLVRGSVSLFIGVLLSTNISAIHAHPSQLVVGVGSIAALVTWFYGVWALLKGATSVLQFLSKFKRAPSCASDWYGITIFLIFSSLLTLACTAAVGVGLWTEYVPALSKSNRFVSRNESPAYYWIAVIVWCGFTFYAFKMTRAVLRLMWPKSAGTEKHRDEIANNPRT